MTFRCLKHIAAGLILAALSSAQEHHLVYREASRFGGWPANHGIWSWGNEILVGFSAAWYKKRAGDRHQMDAGKPEEPRLARSLDGGEHWHVETPRSLLPPAQGGKAPEPLRKPLHFTNPDFAMTLRFLDNHRGPSLLWYSYDRGRTWHGPHEFPRLGTNGVAARTDYVVNGPRDCTVFLTAAKSNLREGRPFAARTTDGGLRWKFLGWIGPEPEGFAIMPSTVRLGPLSFLTAVRVKQDLAHNWVDIWRSDDEGAHWSLLGKAGDTGAQSGSASSMIRLKDGRICLTYASRSKPFPILARISADEGRTWGPVITLRSDAVAWDMGYPRSVQRPDGKVVTVYYYNDSTAPERFIAATIWTPPPTSSR
jgi:hypothetical protein